MLIRADRSLMSRARRPAFAILASLLAFHGGLSAAAAAGRRNAPESASRSAAAALAASLTSASCAGSKSIAFRSI